MLDLVMRMVKARSENMEDLINEYKKVKMTQTKGETNENILHE